MQIYQWAIPFFTHTGGMEGSFLNLLLDWKSRGVMPKMIHRRNNFPGMTPLEGFWKTCPDPWKDNFSP